MKAASKQLFGQVLVTRGLREAWKYHAMASRNMISRDHAKKALLKGSIQIFVC
jgi:hypothetical protein